MLMFDKSFWAAPGIKLKLGSVWFLITNCSVFSDQESNSLIFKGEKIDCFL